MTAPVLKSTLGDGGSWLTGSDFGEKPDATLYDLLKNIIKLGFPLQVRQAAAATAVLFKYTAQFDGVLGDYTFAVQDAGSANTSTVVVKKNGSAVSGATLSIANTAADGTAVSKDLSALAGAPFVKGDIIVIEVTAIATAATDLDVVLHLRPASIQA